MLAISYQHEASGELPKARTTHAASAGHAQVRCLLVLRRHVQPHISRCTWKLSCALVACRTMVTQLITHERIETTLPRAKELRRLADQVVTLGKQVRHGRCSYLTCAGAHLLHT